ncbi:MAG: DASS family sodium-coupled anion symporter [Thermoanaerobaculales bacterium]|jgi:sodium-dependent dicarboxylate transporter 2/3/5|nr:DASS family sodium-coupled anion symporter [Thermoanaerobaculales bacterium]
MVFRNKYFQIALAIVLGLIINLLPRPEGTLFDIVGDPDQRLIEVVAAAGFTPASGATDQTTTVGEDSSVYRLVAEPGVETPGEQLVAAAGELDSGIEVRYVNGLSPKAFRFLALLAALLFLFVFEPIPLEITAILIGVTLVGFKVVDLTSAWATYMHPVVVFIMCCLIFAIALEKAELTERLSNAVARRAGTSVTRFTFLLAISLGMASTVMHDAAATAIGIATMIPLMRAAGIQPNTNTARFVLLSIAFACSCGGMGTLVGGGRCMVAAAFLKELTGIEISFLDWIKFAFPLAMVTVPAAVTVVWLVYRPDPSIKLPRYDGEAGPWSPLQKQTAVVLGVAFLFWLTKGLHGIDYSVTGMVAVAVLVAIGVLKWRDIHENLEWGTAVFIFGGGLCLGLAMASSGAASYFAYLFFPLVEGKGWLVLLAGVCVFGSLVTNAMANVAAAALILPIVIPLAQLEGVDPRVLALGLACATSFAMILVIGCPPNAIAYSYRQFRAVDLTKVGLVATPVLLILLLVSAGIWWSVLGLL